MGDKTPPWRTPLETENWMESTLFHRTDIFWLAYQNLRSLTRGVGRLRDISFWKSRLWLTRSNALLASRKQPNTDVWLKQYLEITHFRRPVHISADTPLLKPNCKDDVTNAE